MKPEIAFSRPYMFKEEQEAAARVIASAWIVGGSRLLELERLFAEHCQVNHAVGVSSWTTGAFLVLHAWGIGPGDEVIVPSYSFIATANVVRQTGATPVFCDIDPVTYNIDIEHARTLVSSRTKAILPVDQLGMPCDIEAVNSLAQDHGLHVLQDAACSLGSTYRGRPMGKDAEVAAFSLHARKIVTCGEGGMIVTNDAALARQLRLLRHHGMSVSDFERHNSKAPVLESYELVGYNMRITDIQAAIAVVQFGRLPELLRLRRLAAERYRINLASSAQLVLPCEPSFARGNWQSYMVRLQDDCGFTVAEILAEMQERGVPCKRGVMAAHVEPCYSDKIARIPPLPNTDHALSHNFLLPMHPGLSESDVDYVCQALSDVLSCRQQKVPSAGSRP
jgi:perosamine synthetase